MKTSLIHMQIRSSTEENLKAAKQMIYEATKDGADYICLPEYFSIPDNLENRNSIESVFKETYEATIYFLKEISKNVKAYIIGGTLVEKFRGEFYNTCCLLRNGEVLGKYRKMHLTEWERKLSLNQGRTVRVFDTVFGKVGILICADIFFPKSVKKLVLMGAEVIFLPVSASGTHPVVNGHPLSVKRARENLVFILKNGNVKSNSRGGRTAIISPWGIVNEVENEFSEQIISADLDLTKLRSQRRRTVSE